MAYFSRVIISQKNHVSGKYLGKRTRWRFMERDIKLSRSTF